MTVNKIFKLLLMLVGLFVLILSLCSCSSNNLRELTETEQYTLTVNIIGQGTVGVDGQNLGDGEQTAIDEDAAVDLEEMPGVDWVFNDWIGSSGGEVVEESGSYQLLMDGDKEITAVFVEEATIRVEQMTPTAEGDDEIPTYYSISTALDSAVDGDVIEVTEGTYYENININNNITIRSTYPLDPDVVAATVIDGDGNDTAVKIYNDCHLYGFKITNGDSQYDGGGIYIKTDASPVVEYNIITGNRAKYGGGIRIYYTTDVSGENTAVIRNNIITENLASKYGDKFGGIGGGIYMYNSAPDISGNIISGNDAEANAGGIAVYSDSIPSIYSNVITDNEADVDDNDSGSGGGIFITDGCDIKDASGNSWVVENTPPADEPHNSYEGNTHYDGDTTDSLLNGADVYWWSIES